MPGGRTGAETHPHARPDEFDGAGGRGAFVGIEVHVRSIGKRGARLI